MWVGVQGTWEVVQCTMGEWGTQMTIQQNKGREAIGPTQHALG